MIAQALVKAAHAIDSRFDEHQDRFEKLEHRLSQLKRNFDSQVNSQVQLKQAEIGGTMQVFQECVSAVKTEVMLRKQNQKQNKAKTLTNSKQSWSKTPGQTRGPTPPVKDNTNNSALQRSRYDKSSPFQKTENQGMLQNVT